MWEKREGKAGVNLGGMWDKREGGGGGGIQEGFLTTNSNFQIPLSFNSDIVYLRYFKIWILLDQIVKVWNIKGLRHQVERIYESIILCSELVITSFGRKMNCDILFLWHIFKNLLKIIKGAKNAL